MEKYEYLFKTGYIAQTRNGWYDIITEEYLVNIHGYLYKDRYYKSLQHEKYKHSEFDVVRIYSINYTDEELKQLFFIISEHPDRLNSDQQRFLDSLARLIESKSSRVITLYPEKQITSIF